MLIEIFQIQTGTALDGLVHCAFCYCFGVCVQPRVHFRQSGMNIFFCCSKQNPVQIRTVYSLVICKPFFSFRFVFCNSWCFRQKIILESGLCADNNQEINKQLFLHAHLTWVKFANYLEKDSSGLVFLTQIHFLFQG